MNTIIRKLLLVPAFALVGSCMIPTAFAQKTDFALLDMEPTVADKSVQCGATRFSTTGEITQLHCLHHHD